MEKTILLVDDDPSIQMLIGDVLRENGLEVICVGSGEEALEQLSLHRFDLVLLDIMLAGISGFDVCRKVRERVRCPILFLSARGKTSSIVEGLRLGADDYITKPFAVEELVARVDAHLRRETRLSAMPRGTNVLSIGEIVLDLPQRRVTRAKQAVALSTREMEVLEYLMRNAGKTRSREQIFRDVWKTDYGDVGAVAINIKNLRSKLDPNWDYIKTVWGSGYCFVAPTSFCTKEEDRQCKESN